jgi:two-component system OmpR family response regulator
MTGTAPSYAQGARVLIVDDDPRISELLVATLRFSGFVVDAAADAADAFRRIPGFRPQLIVLDVMLPDVDGFDVARRLRAEGSSCPVLFLSARDQPDDKVAGLMLGGDDYVSKPFSVAEVVARIYALLRRTRTDTTDGVLTYADLRLDENTHRVMRGDRLIELSPTEYRLLRYLMLNAGRVVSKAQILDRVWQYDFGGDGAVVEKFVSNLRRKIDAVGPPLVQTVRGFGYMLHTPSA